MQQQVRITMPPQSFLEGDISLLSMKEVCELHILAKAAEDALTADRIRVEKELIRRLGLPDIGKQKTHSLQGDGYRVTIKQDASYKMDWPMWGEVRSQVPEALRPTKWIEAIDKSKVKYLRHADPAVFAVVAQALSTTPNKPGVTVEPIAAA